LSENLFKKIQSSPIPRHLAVIMDGNGRWAKKKGLPRLEGHRKGAEIVQNLLDTSLKLKIKYISLYAFSTENWKRPKLEIKGLFEILNDFIALRLSEMHEKGVRILISGDISKLPQKSQNLLKDAISLTRKNKKITVNFCLNYGGRAEIHRAAENLLKAFLEEKFNQNKKIKITEKIFQKYLYTAQLPDIDLMIRTAGEKRISNFLLYQSAYAEFYFTEKTWPEFNESEFLKSIIDFQHRVRKYGGL